MENAPDPGTPERVLARSLRAMREARGLTQKAVAAEMAACGFPTFRQTVVAKIEGGQRPVTVNEGAALAAILGLSLADLISGPASDDEARLAEVEAAVAGAEADLTAAVRRAEAAEAMRQEALNRLTRLTEMADDLRNRAGRE